MILENYEKSLEEVEALNNEKTFLKSKIVKLLKNQV